MAIVSGVIFDVQPEFSSLVLIIPIHSWSYAHLTLKETIEGWRVGEMQAIGNLIGHQVTGL